MKRLFLAPLLFGLFGCASTNTVPETVSALPEVRYYMVADT